MNTSKTFLLIITLILLISTILITKATSKENIWIYKNSRGNVLFNHDKHEGYGCDNCHPPFEKKYSDENDKTDNAHNICINCHFELNKGPTTCNECHIKSE